MLSPRLLLPNSRLWLPGMPLNPLGRFGVCANCCGPVTCTGACVTGGVDYTPSSFLLTVGSPALSGADECATDISGEFVMEQKDGENPCYFFYDLEYAPGQWGQWMIPLLASSLWVLFHQDDYLSGLYWGKWISPFSPTYHCNEIDQDVAWFDSQTGCTDGAGTIHVTAIP